MKSETYLNKIQAEQACSIHTAELLTKALHREGKLSQDKAVRFSPLYAKFDIVNADFLTAGFREELCSGEWLSIEELREKFNW